MFYSRINSIFVLLGILVANLFSSCTSSINHSSNDLYEKEYEVENFSRIKFEGAYNVELIQDSEESLVMKTSEKLHDKIHIWVDNNVLHIKTNERNINNNEVQLAISFKDLNNINVEGGVLLKSKGTINLNDFDIHIEGGAHVDMTLTANKITATAEGAVNLVLEGETNELTAILEGAGNIDADELKAGIVDCRVSGVGNASVYATNNLHAKVEGLGKISYRGNPTLNKEIDGIGFVYKK